MAENEQNKKTEGAEEKKIDPDVEIGLKYLRASARDVPARNLTINEVKHYIHYRYRLEQVVAAGVFETTEYTPELPAKPSQKSKATAKAKTKRVG